MLHANRLWWFLFTLVLLSPVVLAQTSTQTCNSWQCITQQRIDALVKHVQYLTKLLGLPDYNDVTLPSSSSKISTSSRPTVTPARQSSTFGTPKVALSTPTRNVAITPSRASSTVRSIAVSNPSSVAYLKPEVDDRNGYRSVAYFGNWDIYARKYFPQQIPASKLTHLLYAFADNTPDGNITLSDSYADTEIHLPGDSWSDTGKNVYGSFKQLGLLKQKNRNLKVLLSIGGWTYTNTKKNLDPVGVSEAARKNFAASCVNMIKNYGFDGIDVDWEYPQNTEQGREWLALMREIRQALDTYADYLSRDKGYAKEARPHFLLSIAAPAGADNYNKLPLREMAEVLDMVNLMAYDFAGSWDNVTAHASNLAPSKSNPKSTPYDTNSVISHYISAGVPSSKINLGMPLYGRAFTNTAGLGQPYNGIGKGTWEAGVYDFKDLPLKGATEYFDREAYATYSYDNSTAMMVSYDTVDMALTKVKYIKQNKLGGAMWWEVSGDRNDSGSIISNVVREMSGADGRGIESKPNWIYYPDSQFDNVKGGFKG